MKANTNVRVALLVVAAVRAAAALAAIPLAPFLYKKHAAVLVLLRPTKEVLLFAGFSAHDGDLWLPAAVLAAVPILLGGVWLFFGLGRVYGSELKKHELPGLAGRVLPRSKLQKMERAIEREGDKVVFLARLAAMPSSLVAAAAGASGYDTRRFLLIDGAGALCSLALMVGLGWLLEDAYESAGPWLTGVGVVVLAAIAVVIGRALSRDEAPGSAAHGASSKRRSERPRRKSHHQRRGAAARRG